MSDRGRGRGRGGNGGIRGRGGGRGRGGNPDGGRGSLGSDSIYDPGKDTSGQTYQDKVARIFVGSLNTTSVNRESLLRIFGRFGQITGMTVFKGYGFIQYTSEQEARNALAMTNGMKLANQYLDVKIVADQEGLTQNDSGVSGGYPNYSNPQSWTNGGGGGVSVGQQGPPAPKRAREEGLLQYGDIGNDVEFSFGRTIGLKLKRIGGVDRDACMREVLKMVDQFAAASPAPEEYPQ